MNAMGSYLNRVEEINSYSAEQNCSRQHTKFLSCYILDKNEPYFL